MIDILVDGVVAATVGTKREAEAYAANYRRLFPLSRVTTRSAKPEPARKKRERQDDAANIPEGRQYDGWDDEDHQIASPSVKDHGLGTDLTASIRELAKCGQCLSLKKNFETDGERRVEENLIVELTDRLHGRLPSDRIAEAAAAFRKALPGIREDVKVKKVALLQKLVASSDLILAQAIKSDTREVTNGKLIDALSSLVDGKVSDVEQLAMVEILRNSLEAIDRDGDERKRAILDAITGGPRPGEMSWEPYSVCAGHARFFMNGEEERDHIERAHKTKEHGGRWTY
jgi:hypothetical protein